MKKWILRGDVRIVRGHGLQHEAVAGFLSFQG
jgi:hypothetical protein